MPSTLPTLSRCQFPSKFTASTFGMLAHIVSVRSNMKSGHTHSYILINGPRSTHRRNGCFHSLGRMECGPENAGKRPFINSSLRRMAAHTATSSNYNYRIVEHKSARGRPSSLLRWRGRGARIVAPEQGNFPNGTIIARERKITARPSQRS